MKIVAALTGKLDRAPCAMKAASWASARKTYDGPAETGKVATSAPITGPERSVMIDAVTTNAAATIMRRTRMRMKWSSGDIFFFCRPGLRRDDTNCWASERPRSLHPLHRHRDLRAVLDGLIDHAIALGELEQQVELVLRRISVDVEAQAYLGEADRRLLVDAERAAEIEIALGVDVAGLQRHLDSGRDRFQRDAGAGDQRLEQHVARAELEAGAAGCGMQAGHCDGAAGLDLADDAF